MLALELLNPLFGFWHALSEGLIVAFSVAGAGMLQHYSSRMASDIYLCQDGKHVKINFMNAFFPTHTEKLRILNFCYLQESRILNVSVASYEQKRSIYINLGRNAFVEEEYKNILERVFTG